MKTKISIIFFITSLFFLAGLKPVFALEHLAKNRLFMMDVPEAWQWVEYPEEIVITYPDAKTVAIDIQMVSSPEFSKADIKKTIKEANDKLIKDGIEAHNATLIDNKEIKVDGVYATQIDFKTAPPNIIYVTYISFFNKGYAFTITYGGGDDKMRLLMDDVVATFKFK